MYRIVRLVILSCVVVQEIVKMVVRKKGMFFVKCRIIISKMLCYCFCIILIIGFFFFCCLWLMVCCFLNVWKIGVLFRWWCIYNFGNIKSVLSRKGICYFYDNNVFFGNWVMIINMFVVNNCFVSFFVCDSVFNCFWCFLVVYFMIINMVFFYLFLIINFCRKCRIISKVGVSVLILV